MAPLMVAAVRSARGNRTCALAVAVLAAVVVVCWYSAVAAYAECIEYGDYLHWIGGVDTPSSALDVAIAGNHAYVADRNYGLYVIDITNPASPYVVGSVDTPGQASALLSTGTTPTWRTDRRVFK